MLKLSIIIPVYNVENYLRRCLDSAIRPGLEGYEIIIVNDGSTDSSPEVASEYAVRYSGLVSLISTPNGGLGHARNTGIDAAQGEYLLFLDSDDSLSESAVEEALEALEAGFDIGIFDFVSINEQGRQLKYTKGCPREGTFALDEYPELLFLPPNACGKLWRRSLFTENGIKFPDRMWFEDLATSPRLYLKAEKIQAIARPWYNYLLRPGSITNSANIERNLEIISAVDMVLEHYRREGCFERYRDELEYMAIFHQLITASVRVNLLDTESPVQDKLLQDMADKFPDYKNNPLLKKAGFKYRLLCRLISGKNRAAVNKIMTLNNLLKRKDH